MLGIQPSAGPLNHLGLSPNSLASPGFAGPAHRGRSVLLPLHVADDADRTARRSEGGVDGGPGVLLHAGGFVDHSSAMSRYRAIAPHAGHACIHAFVRSRPASSLHAMSRLQRYADAFAIAPHAVQDVTLAPMPASMPSRSPLAMCLRDACIHAFVRSRPASSLHAMSRLQRYADAFAIAPPCSPRRCLGPDACIHAFVLSPLAMRHVTLPRP